MKHGRAASRSADRRFILSSLEARQRRGIARLIVRLLVGIALSALVACARPPGQSVEPLKSVEAGSDPARDSGLGPAGRSGPPPLGLIASATDGRGGETRADQATPAQATRAAPSIPPRKPDATLSKPVGSVRLAARRTLPQSPRREAGDEARTDPPAEPGTTEPGTAGPDQAAGSLDAAEDLMGLTADALTALLGSPSVVRREAPAQIWQYRRSSCVFDVFLYEESGAFRVAYFEARDDQARKQPVEPCLSEILGRAIPSSAG